MRIVSLESGGYDDQAFKVIWGGDCAKLVWALKERMEG